MGSGSTAVAAVNARRHYVGFETDPDYVKLARSRATKARPDAVTSEHPSIADALESGEKYETLVAGALEDAGFADVKGPKKVAPGLDVPLVATDASGDTWHIEVAGSLLTARGGLRSGELAWRTLGRVGAILTHVERLLVVTPEMPVGMSADMVASTLEWLGVTALVDPMTEEGFAVLEAIASA